MEVFLNLLAISANLASLFSLYLQLKGMHNESKLKKRMTEKK